MQTRFPTVVGLAAGLLVGMTATVQAQFQYTTSGGRITIMGYTGPGGDVVIPDTINGLPVTSIGWRTFAGASWETPNTSLISITIPDSVISISAEAFYRCTSLTSITIPDSVTSIEVGTFQGCTGLISITIPASVTSIGDSAFGGCTSLASIVIPDSVTSIGNEAFSGCRSLTSIDIPDSVTNLGAAAFFGCSSLTSATIGPGVTALRTAWYGQRGRIALGAFKYCTGLISVELSSNLTTIEAGAFESCTSLASVMLPESVTSIGSMAFSGCTSLTEIGVTAENPAYSSVNGVLFNKLQTELIQFPGGKTGTYIIPKGVICIGNHAFAGCSSLTSISIPNGVTCIGKSAFSGCAGLTSIAIPSSVTGIGAGAFLGCTALTSVTIPQSVTRIEDIAFSGCTNLTEVYFQGNAPAFESYVFDPVFDGSDKITIYYLADTTGWEPTYDGRSTAPWTNPVILRGTLGMEADVLGFTIAWAPGATVVVEAATGPIAPTWAPVSTYVLAGGLAEFYDPEPATGLARFYRLRSP